MNEEYIGDGLYASFDGYQFKLRTPRENGDHEVYLELPVYERFLEYARQSLVDALATSKSTK